MPDLLTNGICTIKVRGPHFVLTRCFAAASSSRIVTSPSVSQDPAESAQAFAEKDATGCADSFTPRSIESDVDPALPTTEAVSLLWRRSKEPSGPADQPRSRQGPTAQRSRLRR
jgi:hypothetical protein